MNRLVYVGIGIPMLWLQVALAPHLAVFGLKPNLLLVSQLVLCIRWLDPWFFLYAAGAGLAMDALSHGILGIYGTSFCLIVILGRLGSMMIYEKNWLFTGLLVAALSLGEGMISLGLLAYMGEPGSWWGGVFTVVVPVSLYHGAVTPLFLLGLARLERWLKIPNPGT